MLQVMEDDEHYVDDPKNPQFQHHGGEYAYQGGNSGGDFEGEGFQGEHEGFEASGTVHQPCTCITVCYYHGGLTATLHASAGHAVLPSCLLVILCIVQLSVRAVLWSMMGAVTTGLILLDHNTVAVEVHVASSSMQALHAAAACSANACMNPKAMLA
jgi:hypothetical protein